MDYCSSCRRHLNGALVCPGCGAYAPDIAPVTTHDRVVPARVAQPTYTTTYTDPTPWTEPSRGPASAASHASSSSAGSSYGSSPYASPDASSASSGPSPLAPSGSGSAPDVEPAPDAPRGRAARRRQLARWKKHQRRAVVATAVALVGGGLTVAALDRQGGDRTQAAAAPELPTSPGGEEPTSDHTRPTVTRSDAHRPDPATLASQSPATELGGERYAPSDPRPGAAASAPPTRTRGRSASGQGTGTSPYGASVAAPGGSTGQQSSTSSGSSGTSGSSGSSANGGTGASSSTSTPNSSSDAASQSTTGSGSNSGAGTSSSRTNPAPAATSPSEVCLLGLLCLS